MKRRLSNTATLPLVAMAFSLLIAGCSEDVLNTNAVIGDSVTSDLTLQDLSNKSSLESYIYSLEHRSCNFDIADVLANGRNYSNDDRELAAYLNIKRCGYTINDVKCELENIMVYSQIPSCFDQSFLDLYLSNLSKTIPIENNPFVCYLPLAIKVHTLTCVDKHYQNGDIYTCNSLWQKANEPSFTIEDYLDRYLIHLEPYQRIKISLRQNPHLTINHYILELENMLIHHQNPSCMSEESWQENFGLLVATLSERESLYDYYLILAVDVHNLLYPEDQIYQNEFGIYTSDALKLVKAQ